MELIRKHRILFTCVFLFITTLFFYLVNLPNDYQRNLSNHNHRRLITTNDAFSNTFLPYTLLKYKTFTFNNVMNGFYLTQDSMKMPYFITKSQNNYVSKYPIFTGIMATPIYAIPLFFNKIPGLDYHEYVLKILVLGRISASIYASLSVVLFYLILETINSYGKLNNKSNHLWSLIFTFFYAFGTVTYSISSRTLWQHTTGQFLISLVILFLLYGLKDSKYIKWTGLFIGMAVLVRPTSLIIAAILTLYVFFLYKNEFKRYLLFVTPTILFLLFYNYFIFGSPLKEGYQAVGDTSFTFNTLEGTLGLMLSPNRGLLFLSPPLLIGIYYIFNIFKNSYKSFKNKSYDLKNRKEILYLTLSISFLAQLLLMASWYCWWGADSFGYRMLTEVLPIIGLFAYEGSKNYSKILKIIVGVFMVYSIYVHANSVFFNLSRCENQDVWGYDCLLPARELLELLK